MTRCESGERKSIGYPEDEAWHPSARFNFEIEEVSHEANHLRR